jgi:hypothetical protein
MSSQEIHRQRVLVVREAGSHAARFLHELRQGPRVFGDQLTRMAGLVERHGPAAVDRACELRYRVRFTTSQELAATLRASVADERSEARIAELVEPDLLILDELGFTPLDRILADAFYRVVASRYEQSSAIVTSNKSFESRGEVFPDPVIATAVLDRLGLSALRERTLWPSAQDLTVDPQEAGPSGPSRRPFEGPSPRPRQQPP